MRYLDREDAGRQLAELLAKYRPAQPVVLGLLRGGIVVALEVANALQAPLDLLVVRKVGVPGHPEFAMGATAPGVTWLDEELIGRLHLPRYVIEGRIAEEARVVSERDALFRRGRPPLPLQGKTVILVDDGLATGATAVAGLRVVRKQHPARLIFAAPLGSPEGIERVRPEADEVVCPAWPPGFHAVSQGYRVFTQVSDAEVRHCLAAAADGSREGISA